MQYEASLWTVVWTRPGPGRVVRGDEQRRAVAVGSPETAATAQRRRTADARCGGRGHGGDTGGRGGPRPGLPATVSRVLNGNYPVAASTRERVLKAVDDLDYVLNGPASALAAVTSDLVGILVNDIADPFFGIMAGAIQSRSAGRAAERAAEARRGLQHRRLPERELTYLTLLQRQRAAAVVLTGGAMEDAAHQAAVAAKLRKLAEAGTRVVLCGRPPAPDTGAIALTFDNRGGGRGADRPPDRAQAPAARLHRGPGGAHHDPAPAGGPPRRARRARHRGGPPLGGPRPLRPAVRLRGHARTSCAGTPR